MDTSVDEVTREGMRWRWESSAARPPSWQNTSGDPIGGQAPNFAARPPRPVATAPPIVFEDSPDDARLTALEARVATLGNEIPDLWFSVRALEAAPPMTGWRGWLFGAATSRRFQLAVAAILGTAATWLGGAIDGNAALIAIITTVIGYLTAETATDIARAKANR